VLVPMLSRWQTKFLQHRPGSWRACCVDSIGSPLALSSQIQCDRYAPPFGDTICICYQLSSEGFSFDGI
jgi:hypothetical protein